MLWSVALVSVYFYTIEGIFFIITVQVSCVTDLLRKLATKHVVRQVMCTLYSHKTVCVRVFIEQATFINKRELYWEEASSHKSIPNS